VQQEEHGHQSDDDRFLDELAAKRVNRRLDEAGAVIAVHEHHALRQRALDLGHLRLDAVDHVEGVLAIAHHDPAGHDLAATVEISDAAPNVRTELHVRDVGEHNRRSAGPDSERDTTNVVETLEPPTRTNDVLVARHFQHTAAHVGVRVAHGVGDAVERNAIGQQLRGIDVDLILLLEPAKRRDLGDTGYRGERRANCPILKTAEVREIEPACGVGQDVLHHPADAGSVRPKHRLRAVRKLVAHTIQVFEHATARPIEIRVVLEHDVHR
jgi:hypothetical protein